MRRFISISVAVCAALMALSVLFAFAYGPGPYAKVQTSLDTYLAFRNEKLKNSLEPTRIVRATRPEAFKSNMSRMTFANSPFYDTSVDYRPVNAPARPAGRRAPPFPPRDVWCVRLTQGDATPSHFVFIALHGDAVNSDWVLHEPPEDAKSLSQIFDSVRCSP